jgi:nucleotide-binding universal stress UspA family protein
VYRHILVASDGSPFSARAIRTAVALAKSLGAKLTGLHVVAAYAPAGGGMFPASLSGYERELRRQKERALAQLRSEGRKSAVDVGVASVVGGEPWRAILDKAKKRKCDLVVMASHGRTGVAGLLLGSETHKVLTHSTIPVLVCR